MSAPSWMTKKSWCSKAILVSLWIFLCKRKFRSPTKCSHFDTPTFLTNTILTNSHNQYFPHWLDCHATRSLQDEGQNDQTCYPLKINLVFDTNVITEWNAIVHISKDTTVLGRSPVGRLFGLREYFNMTVFLWKFRTRSQAVVHYLTY